MNINNSYSEADSRTPIMHMLKYMLMLMIQDQALSLRPGLLQGPPLSIKCHQSLTQRWVTLANPYSTGMEYVMRLGYDGIAWEPHTQFSFNLCQFERVPKYLYSVRDSLLRVPPPTIIPWQNEGKVEHAWITLLKVTLPRRSGSPIILLQDS